MQENTNNEPNFADLLELDLDRAPAKAAVVPADPVAIELDLTATGQTKCVDCGQDADLNEGGLCRPCYLDRNAPEVPAIPALPSVKNVTIVNNMVKAGLADESDVLPMARAMDAHDAATSSASFADIAAESTSNASASNLGDLANGRATLGVGFHTAEGYAEALRRGVLAHTRAEYELTLKSTYGWTEEQIAAIGAVTIKQDLPVSLNPIVHEGDTDAAVAAIKARAAQKNLNIVATAEAEKEKIVLKHGDVVAGAVADGHGILTHWSGSGPLTVARIREIAEPAGVDAKALPKTRKPKSYANQAVSEIAADRGYSASKEKVDQYAKRNYDHRWRLYAHAAGAGVGEAAGHVVLVVTLRDGELSTEGDTAAGQAVEARFGELSGAEQLEAGHVTIWLGNYLRDHLDAVKYGGCWYVKRAQRPAAEALVNAFSSAWGDNWMNPPTPLATSAQLAKGIAQGLAGEVDATVTELAAANARAAAEKASAVAAGRDTKALRHVGEKAAQGYLRRFREHAERVRLFAELLGAELVASSKAKVEAAVKTLDAIVGEDYQGTGARFALIWDEIEIDLAKGGKA